MIRQTFLTSFCVALVALGCSDDDGDTVVPTAGTGGTMPVAGSGGSTSGGMGGSSTAGSSGSAGSGMAGTGGGDTLCSTYGGPSGVATIVEDHVLGQVMADCRINAFFTVLSEQAATHLSECLVIQFQELFDCPGVTYAGSQDSSGAACRDMATAHAGLGISEVDFLFMIEDISVGLAIGGVPGEVATPLVDELFPLIAQIQDSTAPPAPTRFACVEPDAGAPDAGDVVNDGDAGADASAPDAGASTPTPDAGGDAG